MSRFFRIVLLLIALTIISPLAHGQIAPNEPAVLNNTTLGQSQNDERDLANSLQPGPVKFGKGEKKFQVNAKQLQSKSIKDETFGGSLLNMGIDPTAPKLDAAKENAAPSEEKPVKRTASADRVSSASKQQSASAEQSAATERSGANPPVSDPSNPAKVSEAGFSFSNLSQTATLGDDLGSSGIGAAPATESKPSSNSNPTTPSTDNDPKKDQGNANNSSATSSTDQSSTTKPDDDH